MERTSWQCGDLFAVPQSDRRWSLGQALRHEPRAMDSVLCAFYDVRLAEPALAGVAHLLTPNRLVAIELVTRDALDRGRWPILGNAPTVNVHCYGGLGALRRGRFVAVSVVPSSRIVALLEAWFGLRPWRGGPDPQALERLVYPGATVPQ